MIVSISNRQSHEWSAVCSQFGVDLEPVHTIEQYGVDGEESSTINRYFVSDEHMATWIKIIKPRWIVRE
jgi:hypothetical protein